MIPDLRELPQAALVAFLIAAVAAFTIVGLVRRSRTFVLVGLVMAVALVPTLGGLPRDVPAPWRSVIGWGIVAAMIAFVWVAVIQEPVWLAYRLGFIRRSPEWEYDVVLARLLREFGALLHAAQELDIAARNRGEPPPAAKREALRAEAEAIVARIRSSEAPSEEWAVLASECVEMLEHRLQHFGVPITNAEMQQVLELDAKTTAHRDQLVADYSAKATGRFRWP